MVSLKAMTPNHKFHIGLPSRKRFNTEINGQTAMSFLKTGLKTFLMWKLALTFASDGTKRMAVGPRALVPATNTIPRRCFCTQTFLRLCGILFSAKLLQYFPSSIYMWHVTPSFINTHDIPPSFVDEMLEKAKDPSCCHWATSCLTGDEFCAWIALFPPDPPW